MLRTLTKPFIIPMRQDFAIPCEQGTVRLLDLLDFPPKMSVSQFYGRFMRHLKTVSIRQEIAKNYLSVVQLFSALLETGL